MSSNRIVYALMSDHDRATGKYGIIQRVVISKGRSLADAEKAIAEKYPTAQFLAWVTTYEAHYNGNSDIRVA